MLRSLLALMATLVALPCVAQELSYPANFAIRDIATNGTTIHVRVGGYGPAVVLLHGYGETGDMWAPMAAELARDHTVDRARPARDGPVVQTGRRLRQENPGRRRGGRARQLEDRPAPTSSLTTSATWSAMPLPPSTPTACASSSLIDAPVPGVGPWDEILKNPLLWHFRFGGPDMERLVAGRERIYLDRFWNEFSADPARFSEAAREHYAKLYALPGRDALRLCAVRRLRSGRHRQPGLPRKGQAEDAGAGPRRREVLRTDDGGRHAFAADDVREASCPTPATGSWKRTRRRRSKWCARSSNDRSRRRAEYLIRSAVSCPLAQTATTEIAQYRLSWCALVCEAG